MSSEVRPAEKSSRQGGDGAAPSLDAARATPPFRAPAVTSESPPELELIVEAGPDAGARYVLSASRPSPTLVGQSATCDFRLRDRSISRHHAAIDASSGRFVVHDLGSTNGTFVNGVAVVEARLVGRETLRFGGTTLRVDCHAASQDEAPDGRLRFGETLGASRTMRALYLRFDRLAASTDPVLIDGEAGTGKKLLARCLHAIGPRAPGPLVVVDCALEASSLERALRDREDAFERLLDRSTGGTLLLDDLGSLDLPLQHALARALSEASSDPRIVATTCEDLDALVREGRFREDLRERVAVARVKLPPLRAREGDVEHLALHFWIEGGGDETSFPADAIARVEAHAWPGNVRELREFVGRLLAQSTGATGEPPEADADRRASGLAGVVQAMLEADVSYAEARRRLLVEFEHRYVEQMLDVHHGNVTRAAAASGLARRNFQLIRARLRDDGGR